jgi:hypothetical protein
MANTALWKVRSGDFAGWRVGMYLHDADGECVGYFRGDGDIAYSLQGDYIGEILNTDWIGKKLGVSRGSASNHSGHSSMSLSRHSNRSGRGVSGWEDPDF